MLLLVAVAAHPHVGTAATRARALETVKKPSAEVIMFVYPTVSRIICQSFSVRLIRESVRRPLTVARPSHA